VDDITCDINQFIIVMLKNQLETLHHLTQDDLRKIFIKMVICVSCLLADGN